MRHNRRVGIGDANILTMQIIYMASKKLDTLSHIGPCDRNIDYGDTFEFSEF